jgi:predicted outer membrane protein
MRFLALLAVAAAVAVPAASASSSVSACAFDRQFLQSSVQSSLFSIVGGRIAQSRGTIPAVQGLGSRLVADHTAALGAAQRLARRLHVGVPGNPTAEQHWELNVVSGEAGAAFDRRFAWLVAASAGSAVASTSLAASHACAAPVRSLAKQRLATLRAELRLATQAQKAGA